MTFVPFVVNIPLQLRQIADLAAPAGEGEVRPLFDLGVVIVFPVPLDDFSRSGEPNMAVAFGVTDKLAQQQRPERPPADKRMITPHHEFRIARAFFIQTIEAILPHLQEIPRRSPGALVARIVV